MESMPFYIPLLGAVMTGHQVVILLLQLSAAPLVFVGGFWSLARFNNGKEHAMRPFASLGTLSLVAWLILFVALAIPVVANGDEAGPQVLKAIGLVACGPLVTFAAFLYVLLDTKQSQPPTLVSQDPS